MASSARDALSRFLDWWVDELKGLIPQALLAGRRQPRRLVVAVDGPKKRLLMEKAGLSETLAETTDTADGLSSLARLIKARPSLPVGLRLSGSECFSRTLHLPAPAEGDYRRILDLDMERTTPFRAAEVLTAYHVVPADAGAMRGKRVVRHLVVKRRTIDPLLQEMGALGIEPAFIDCWDDQRHGGLPVDFLAATRPAADRPGILRLRSLAAVFVLLVVSAVGIWMLRHQSALAALEMRADAARAEAGNARLAMEASQTASARIEAMARQLRDRLPVGRIVEELTVIIPDDAWLSDLRIEADRVEFTGLAKSAAALVPLLESSPLFEDVSLTSPVVLDNNEDKERFSMRMLLAFRERPAEGAAESTGDADGIALQ